MLTLLFTSRVLLVLDKPISYSISISKKWRYTSSYLQGLLCDFEINLFTYLVVKFLNFYCKIEIVVSS
jgi:hypothetical protein